MRILQEVCSIPTAPFVEDRVVAYVERFVRERKGLRLRRDGAGNLLIELPGKARGGPRWVFGAHMDHPGFVVRRMLDGRTAEADFRGGVRLEYVVGTKARFFEGEREVVGTVVEATAQRDRPESVGRVKVRVEAALSRGTLGMFDQGEGRVKDGVFYCRGIDDNGGSAAALAMLDELHRRPPRVGVAVLLTRAEEAAFIGAIAAVKEGKLLRKSDRIIAIECSSVLPHVPQGGGAIIRVGDRTSVFNSDLTYFVTYQAEQLAGKDRSFKFQRALMSGGTCEATVYDVYGHMASSICVALGNYHNMDVRKKRIGPEYIDVADWKNMVKLFVQVARHGHEFEPGHALLKARLEKRFEAVKGML